MCDTNTHTHTHAHELKKESNNKKETIQKRYEKRFLQKRDHKNQTKQKQECACTQHPCTRKGCTEQKRQRAEKINKS